MSPASLSELQRWLGEYQPASGDDATHRDRMQRLLETPAPFSRAQFEPGHFTASSFVLAPSRDQLLLIFHSKLQRWLQPGGHIETADTDVLTAARRELREETGLPQFELLHDGLFDVDVHPIPARRDDPAHLHFDLRFAFVAATDSIRAGSDAAAARWVALRDVPKIETDESVLRALRRLTP